MRCFFATLALLSLIAPIQARAQSSDAAADHAADHARLAALYEQDQADRRGGHDVDWSIVSRRDAERRAEVQRLLDADSVRTAADHYHAAMIFQHGDDSTAYRQARDLAREAERLGSERARWLAAAAHDRHLLSIGEPQHYGTQFLIVKDTWYLSPLDSTAVSDAERLRVGTRTLAEIRAFLAEKNGTETGSLTAQPEPFRPH